MLDDLLSWADVVLVEFPWQFAYCRRRRLERPIVLASHNVEADKFESWARAAGATRGLRPWLSFIRRAEAAAVTGADLVLAVSEADRELMSDRYGIDRARVVVVPNGADVDRYAPVDSHTRAAAKRALGLPDRPTVLYAGSDVPPNWAGLRWVRRLAAGAPGFTFLVVGRVSRPVVDGNLIATGLVEDFALHLAASDFSLCPIEHGGGTKLKLLESLAAGLPTVAFAEALNGLEVRDREHVLVAAKREQDLLAALERLSSDREFARALGASARRQIQRAHAWEVIADRLDGALSQLIAEDQSSPSGGPIVAASGPKLST